MDMPRMKMTVTSSDKISYGDDKSGKSDVEELKLFDVEDDK